MATLSCSTRAADLPRAIMIRPQLGSWPLMAVFTSGELATLRAATSASFRLAAPRTMIETSLVAPSPSCTSMRASRPVSASSAAANSRVPRPPRSIGGFSARPLAMTATVSLVEVSLSTVMRLNERSTVRLSTGSSAPRATAASVVTKQNIVAMWGSIMPTPLAIPPRVTVRPPISQRSAASFVRVSVVRMASAAACPPCGESDFTSVGMAARILSIGSGWPMTPVAPTSTCEAGIRSRSATCLTISRASRMPRSPLQTLEQPLLTTIVCRAPPRACSMETSTGAPFTWFVVNTAAERAGEGEWMRARSFLPLGLMPAATPAARMPGTAVTPPSSHSRSPVIGRSRRGSGVHRRGLEAGPLVPAEEDVEILHAVGRAALSEVVDRRHADDAARARVGHRGDVAEVRAHHRARRRPLALAEHAHEGLTRVELAIDVHEVRRAQRRRQGHRGRREQAPRERQQVGCERHPHALARERGQFLLHLCGMAVGADRVGLHVLVGLGVEIHRVNVATLRAGAAHPRLAVDHDALEPRQAVLEQRRRREDRARRIAARRGHERGRRDRLAVQLRQSVDGLGEPGGIDVRRLVPGRVVRGVVQAVVGREVDHLAALAAQH